MELSRRFSTSSLVYSFFVLIVSLTFLTSCNDDMNKEVKPEAVKQNSKIAVLLVNHGSRSENWRKMLLDIETQTRDKILENKNIADVKTAFMEYNEPSIATRLKEFDDQGFTHVIIVPVLLTVSTHSFDDIPTIAGIKDDALTLKELKGENIKTYKAKAKVIVTSLLDFPKVLNNNVSRRVKAISENPKDEGVVLVAYGDATYNTEWENLMNRLGGSVQTDLGIDKYNYAWCGHLVHYDPMETTKAINEILKTKKKAIVVPILVAVDEYFQGMVIGEGIKKASRPKDVIYKSDAILPEPEVNQWVIDIANQSVKDIISGK